MLDLFANCMTCPSLFCLINNTSYCCALEANIEIVKTRASSTCEMPMLILCQSLMNRWMKAKGILCDNLIFLEVMAQQSAKF